MKIPGNTTVQATQYTPSGRTGSRRGVQAGAVEPQDEGRVPPGVRGMPQLTPPSRPAAPVRGRKTRRYSSFHNGANLGFPIDLFRLGLPGRGNGLPKSSAASPGNTRSASLRPRLGPPGCPRPPTGVLGTVSPTGLDSPKHVTVTDRLEWRVGRLADLATSA